MENVMFGNEMKCLSNAVLQQCWRDRLETMLGVPPLVRQLVTENAVDVSTVLRVEMHQCPRGKGLVHYEMHLLLSDGQSHHLTFQGSGFEATHRTYVLYDRARDGKVTYLHLVH